ncbi:membrane-bound lytic murein transglycosylase C [Helicobacter cinaedi]|uniref:murein transglycosylase domain-containing protein n=1 Tax=Helicobacter cinaedi TaxID=213 RepID=UPI001F40184B|nr:murein transglycosylase domain-containing protein [Helicobacter cinaedi]BDB64566.1 membrane-bound lytic murein transglycosylase C [Helicobacter cinaedi]
MKQYAQLSITLALALAFFGCSALTPENAVKIAIADDPNYAMRQIAGNQFRIYATDSKALMRDIKEAKRQYTKVANALSGNVAKQWSKEDVSLPSAESYVKYSNNYKSKATINFHSGAIRIETIDTSNPTKSLEQAITNTLLLPQDPSKVDLYSADDFKFDGKPFLAGLIKDHDGQDILTQWRAERYAKYLVENELKTRKDSKGKLVSYVDLQMVGDYQSKSEHKYEDLVLKYAHKYNVSPALVLGIIQTESNFNPYAVSNAPAYGLMQVVPSTAGADAYELINGKKGMPTKEMLFNPETNIEYGVAYLSILFNRYLASIKDKQSQEYCVITAYNAGAGSVLRTFANDKNEAFNRINAMSAQKVYDTIQSKLPSSEGRRYLMKVTTHKKNYEHIQ